VGPRPGYILCLIFCVFPFLSPPPSPPLLFFFVRFVSSRVHTNWAEFVCGRSCDRMKRLTATRSRLPPNGTKPNRSGLTVTTDARGSALPTVLALLQMGALLTMVCVEASPHSHDQAQVCMRARCSPHVPAPTRSQSENWALCSCGLRSFGRCLAVAMIRPDHASQAYHVMFDARITPASLDAVKRFLARCTP
jgi:hypothetical protein